MKLTGDYSPRLAIARDIIKNDAKAGEFYKYDEHGDVILVVDDENPDCWEVWLSGEPVDYLNPSGVGTARELVNHLDVYTGSGGPRRGIK